MTWLILILIVVNALILTYLIFRSKQQIPYIPDCTILQAWDYYLEHGARLWGGDTQQKIDTLLQFHPDDIEEVKKELLEIEEKSKKSENPLIPLREAIMDCHL